MNFLALTLPDNLLVVLVLVGLSALSTWWTKRRREKETADRPEAAEVSAALKAPMRPIPQLRWEDVLRQLLGNEPVAQASTPAPSLPVPHVDPPSLKERAAQLVEQHRKPTSSRPVGSSPKPWFRALQGTRSVSLDLVSDPRTVRQAFVASLVFCSPKALEGRTPAWAGHEWPSNG